MGVDFLIRRVLDHRAGDGRKLASGHEYPLCQGVASGHPKGRSAAKEPRSGLTRRDVLTPRPTSCGSSRVLFAIYARIYAAVNSSLPRVRDRPRNSGIAPVNGVCGNASADRGQTGSDANGCRADVSAPDTHFRVRSRESSRDASRRTRTTQSLYSPPLASCRAP